jgi:hypothetical protein
VNGGGEGGSSDAAKEQLDVAPHERFRRKGEVLLAAVHQLEHDEVHEWANETARNNLGVARTDAAEAHLRSEVARKQLDDADRRGHLPVPEVRADLVAACVGHEDAGHDDLCKLHEFQRELFELDVNRAAPGAGRETRQPRGLLVDRREGRVEQCALRLEALEECTLTYSGTLRDLGRRGADATLS